MTTTQRTAPVGNGPEIRLRQSRPHNRQSRRKPLSRRKPRSPRNLRRAVAADLAAAVRTVPVVAVAVAVLTGFAIAADAPATPKAPAASDSQPAVASAAGPQPTSPAARLQPTSPDARIAVDLFAEHPQIVTPTGLAVDARGRVFVAESHTHFRPDNYNGPKLDRILIFEDTDGDGRADRRTVFHEGFTYVMQIAFHPDGGLYVATRMDIHRLEDTDGDDRADRVTPIIKMETTGTYPHNGISGVCFDLAGHLYFGLGENLGHAYTLVGRDGVRISGGGEGGSTYVARADGTGLRRMSTGWWNPWGMCVDAFGRVFGTDNDPGASPPCRLIQVIDGADYGYEYRYGRTGLHPLITWTGDIPGTLPMIAGTGEAPCAVVAYESDALPGDYRGHLLVASWADHRVEHYAIEQRSDRGLVTTQRRTLIEANGDFRPVGLDVAPDGSVYVSDWVSSSYQLHGQGRIWRIRPKSVPAAFRRVPRSTGKPERDVLSLDRRIREAAARALSANEEGRATLRKLLGNRDDRVRAAAVQALIAVRDTDTDFATIARSDASLPIRVLALRHLLRHEDSSLRHAAGAPQAAGISPEIFAELRQPTAPACLRAEFVRHLDPARPAEREALSDALSDADPLVFHAAVSALAEHIGGPQFESLAEAHPRAGILAMKRSSRRAEFGKQGVPAERLQHPDPLVRFLAVKWIADDMLTAFRPQVAALLDDSRTDYRLFLAVAAALDRLDGKQPQDRPGFELLHDRLQSDSAPVAVRRVALRMIDATDRRLPLAELTVLVKHPNVALRREAVRTLADHWDATKFNVLQSIAADVEQAAAVRADAVAGLAPQAEQRQAFFAELLARADSADSSADTSQTGAAANVKPLSGETRSTGRTARRTPKPLPAVVRDEILRSLVGTELTGDLESLLERLRKGASGSLAEAIDRVLSGRLPQRPAAADIDAWLTLADAKSTAHETGRTAAGGNPAAGEQIFFGRKVGLCRQCHEVDGRGVAVGPPLSRIGRRIAAQGPDGRRWLLETILQPSRQMAPEYTPWQIALTDGRVLIGLPRRKGGNAEAYLGKDGREFTVKKSDIEFHREMRQSLMPDNLLQSLTVQELRDLLAFLTARGSGTE